MKSVVVTGASSGIGRAIAEQLVEDGFQVFGGVRKEEDAQRLSASLGEAFTPVHLDVTEPDTIDSASAEVGRTLGEQGLAGVVNNAGIARPGPLLHVPTEELRRHFEVNVVGVLQVTRSLVPLLKSDANTFHRPGRVVNISSTSGLVAFPFLGAYSASKHALEALSDVLRRELRFYGIDVVVIEPGNVETPMWDKIPDPSSYEETDYDRRFRHFLHLQKEARRKALNPRTVARVVSRVLTCDSPKTRYFVVGSLLAGWLLRFRVPDRLLDWLIEHKLRMPE